MIITFLLFLKSLKILNFVMVGTLKINVALCKQSTLSVIKSLFHKLTSLSMYPSLSGSPTNMYIFFPKCEILTCILYRLILNTLSKLVIIQTETTKIVSTNYKMYISDRQMIWFIIRMVQTSNLIISAFFSLPKF